LASAAAVGDDVQIKSGNILINHAGDCKLGELSFKRFFFFFFSRFVLLLRPRGRAFVFVDVPIRCFAYADPHTFCLFPRCEQICPCAAADFGVSAELATTMSKRKTVIGSVSYSCTLVDSTALSSRHQLLARACARRREKKKEKKKKKIRGEKNVKKIKIATWG